jgi:hypothetical protein
MATQQELRFNARIMSGALKQAFLRILQVFEKRPRHFAFARRRTQTRTTPVYLSQAAIRKAANGNPTEFLSAFLFPLGALRF